MKPSEIDRLYGLEPVFEPSAEAGSDALEQFVDVPCPHCAEILLLRLDLTSGSQRYIEDCQVCCQAIQIDMTVADDGTLGAVEAGKADL